MIENYTTPLEIYTLTNPSDINVVVNAVLNGKIVLIRLGSVFSFILNPKIAGLADKFNFLKDRQANQLLSVVSTYEQAKLLACKENTNPDFYRLPEGFCSKVIVRLPVNQSIDISFPYNKDTMSLQFIDFGDYPILAALKEELAKNDCEFISITSGNLHGLATVENLEDAKKLAVLFNIKAEFCNMSERIVIADIPASVGNHKGSFVILSFCNKNAIEVKRLADKSNREITEKYLKNIFEGFDNKTPLVFDL